MRVRIFSITPDFADKIKKIKESEESWFEMLRN